MNSKELATAISTGSHSHGELFQALVQDAKQLIQARKAQSIEAKRSCYADQNAKWVSAVKKSGGFLDPNEFSNWAKTQPAIKEMFEEPKPKETRTFQRGGGVGVGALAMMAMFGRNLLEYQEQEIRNQEQITETARRLLESYHKFKEDLAKDSRFSADELIPSSASCAVAELVTATCSVVTSEAVYIEYVKLVHAVYCAARVVCPELPERSLALGS